MQTQNTFTLTISRVNELLFSGLAHSVTLPGSEGELTVLAHHEPIISLLKSGKITVHGETGSQEFIIERGMLEVSRNQVTVLL